MIDWNDLEAMMKLLDITALRTSYANGEVSSVALYAVQSAFEVRWAGAYGTAKLADTGGRNGWQFHDPREALLLLKKIGIDSVVVDTAGWQPGVESAFDDWVQAKVESSLAGLEDGSNKIYSPAEWAEIRSQKGWSGTTP